MPTETVAPHEILARVVLGSGMVRRTDNSVRPNVFMPPVGSNRISVHRRTLMSQEEAVRRAMETARLRGKTRFHGWAEVAAQFAGEDHRQVVPDPGENRPHAEILLPAAAVEDRDLRNYHAQRLAWASRWVMPPSGLPGSPNA